MPASPSRPRLAGAAAPAAALAAACLASLAWQPRADACGCFAPPDPSVPVVQAGERILFAMENGEVTAHIQIQYAGNEGEFGWILPLPAVPTLELGTEELFTQLINQTQPYYRLTRVYEGNCAFDPSRFPPSAGPPADAAASADGGPGGGYDPLVYQGSVGPYDFAVLRADRRDEMFTWLKENGYFIPVGTKDVVGPYIRKGAYFLALKLRPGQSTGDLAPVVVKYRSDLPMIPIVLTSVAAQPDMGIQVWMLGAGRAIPRNYYHTVINDSQIDWFSAGQNYNDVIIRATREAPERHTFVTEFAGSSARLQGAFGPPDRFGNVVDLAAQPDEISFVQYLLQWGYPFTPNLLAILQRYIPVPEALTAMGIDAGLFYGDIGYWLGDYRAQNPDAFEGYETSYLPEKMAAEIDERIAQPIRNAAALFERYPYLTRLYTTLSPEDMTEDPVFSFNPGLPDYSNEHSATLTYHCGAGEEDQGRTPATLETESGWIIGYPRGTGERTGDVILPGGPASARIEVLSEEGPPETFLDNAEKIASSLPPAPPPNPGNAPGRDGGVDGDGGPGTGPGIRPPDDPRAADRGCSLATSAPTSPAGALLLALALVGLALVRRRR